MVRCIRRGALTTVAFTAPQQHSARTHTHSMPDDAPKKSFRRTKEARLLLKLGSLGTASFSSSRDFRSMGARPHRLAVFCGLRLRDTFGIIMLIVEIKDRC